MLKDHLKATLKKCHIPPNSLELMDADHTSWCGIFKTLEVNSSKALHDPCTDVSVSFELDIIVIRGHITMNDVWENYSSLHDIHKMIMMYQSSGHLVKLTTFLPENGKDGCL